MTYPLQYNPYAKWVNAREELPPNRQDVLAMKVAGLSFKAWYEPDKKCWYNNIGKVVEVNYWCKMESIIEKNFKPMSKTT